MASFQLTASPAVLRVGDGASIPPDPANRDYAEYLAWIALGNTPDPYVAPAPGIPASVSSVQGRIALLNAGLLDKATAAVTAAGGATAIWWQYAIAWERDNTLLTSLGAALGLTSAQIDQLFLAAAQIK